MTVAVKLKLPTLHAGQVEAFNKRTRRYAIRCGRRWGKCLASGTRVAMADGSYLAVEDVRAGDSVYTVNEETGRIEPRPVMAVHDNGVRETVLVRTSMRTLRCTPNHPLMVDGQWTEARDIVTGMLAAVPRSLPEFGDQAVFSPFADFMAIWLAEGAGSVISNGTPEILAIVHDFAQRHGLTVKHNGGVDYRLKWRGTGQGISPVTAMLQEQGLRGRNSKTKFIPDWVYRLPEGQLARFLNLFVACDGCITRKAKRTWSMEIGLANERMVRQLAELFLKFGIRGQITHKVHKTLNRHGSPYESWRFTVSDAAMLLVFGRRIGALSKEQAVADMIADTEQSAGSCNAYLPLAYDETMRDGADAAALTVLRSWRKQTPSRVSVRRYEQLKAHGIVQPCALLDGDLAWEEVISVEAAEPAQTWDLSLADNHNFFANGICTHNTALLSSIAVDRAAKQYPVGIFAPDNGKLRETFTEIRDMLGDLKLTANRNEGVIRTTTGGRIDFWSLENENPARGRKYKLAMIDEAAFGKPILMDQWKKAIEPTLFDYSGACIVASNTNGEDPENFFYRICTDKTLGFTEFHAPTHANPLLPLRLENETPEAWQVRRALELAKLKADNPPLVYQQEYLAEFVDWSGAAFFSLDSLLVDMGDGPQPYPRPGRCDFVVAIMDTAVKSGTDNDGTAVLYVAFTRNAKTPLMLVDYDIVQIDGDLLVNWVPGVIERLGQLAEECHALHGSAGVFIEDKQTGSTLIMAGQRRGWPVTAIDTALTSVGKDERAIACSPYVFQRKMGITQDCYDKQVKFKGDARNHLVYQVTRFRVGDKDNKRPDDLVDCFCYAALILLGNSKGI